MASSTLTHTGVIRQGDVLIIPLKKLSVNDSVKLPNLILAKGEVTGHSHRISEGKAQLYERNGTLFLRVLSPTAKLQHDEHHPLNIPKGDWMVRIQREYRPIAPVDNSTNQSNDNSQDTLTSKTTFSQKNTLVDSATFTEKSPDNSTEKKRTPLTDDLTDLANQVDFKYWDKLVEEAERRKEYLERIQAKKKKFDEEDDEDDKEYEKPIKRKNRIRYTEAKRESLDNYAIPSPSIKTVSSSRNQSNNWVGNLFNNVVNKQPRNWVDVAD